MVTIYEWPRGEQTERPTTGQVKWFHGSSRWRYAAENGASSAWAVTPSGQAIKVLRLDRKEVEG